MKKDFIKKLLRIMRRKMRTGLLKLLKVLQYCFGWTDALYRKKFWGNLFVFKWPWNLHGKFILSILIALGHTNVMLWRGPPEHLVKSADEIWHLIQGMLCISRGDRLNIFLTCIGFYYVRVQCSTLYEVATDLKS